MALVGLALVFVVPILIFIGTGSRGDYEELGGMSVLLGIALIIGSFIWRTSDEKKY